MAKKLTSSKAKEILSDGTIRGKAISSKQKAFFGAIAGGQRPRAGHQGSPFEKVNPPKFSAAGKLGKLSD